MRILVWGDAGANTGFGVVTHNLGVRWCAMGHEVSMLAINYRGDPWDAPYKLYAASKYSMADLLGLGRLQEVVSLVKPDVLFVVSDLDVVLKGLQQLGTNRKLPVVAYVPIDGDKMPDEWYEAIRQCTYTAVQSHYGAKTVKHESGLDTIPVWHGVEHDKVFPVSEDRPLIIGQENYTSRGQIRKALDVDEKFVVLAVNRNNIRKNYPDTFKAFAEFRKRHEDALLWVHAVAHDEGGNLHTLVDRYKLGDSVKISDPRDTFLGAPKELLTAYYNAADVKISTSMGEGFGLTDAEALACGCPVIAQDCSATTEVVGDAGILVKPQRHFTTARMNDLRLPDVAGFVRALERIYRSPSLRETLSKKAVKQSEKFQWDDAASKLEELMQSAIQKGQDRISSA
ncbi:glycosyltransferase [Alicyclobacillus tolerans]|uniref:glycosyltransferase n=1 Tax=Alicyclobacillus tolerans TaxID=90970 RepID=UPI003B7785F7